MESLSFTEHLLRACHSAFPLLKNEGIEPEDTKLIRSELAQDPGIVVSKAFVLNHVTGDFMTLSLPGEEGEPALDQDMSASWQLHNVFTLNIGSMLI